MPGMQDLADHNALTPCCAADGKTQVFNRAGLPLLVRAVDFNNMVGQRDELLAALAPFVRLNSSEETITITVRTEDVTAARAAIAKATGGAQ